MKKFEVGKVYSMSSVCDHECIWRYQVIKRTACTVTITDGERASTCRINKQVSAWNGVESIFPLGRYSMAPILRAE